MDGFNNATITISGDNTPYQIIDDNGTIDRNDDVERRQYRIDEHSPISRAMTLILLTKMKHDTLARLTILSLPEKGTLLLGGNPISIRRCDRTRLRPATYFPCLKTTMAMITPTTYSVNDGTDDSPIGTMAIPLMR